MQLIHQTEVYRKRQSRHPGGYTLIELAISFAVIGFLLASFLTAYNLYRKNQVKLETENNVVRITAAFTNYLIQNGRYPCPARLDALRADADYGLEGVCDPTNGAYPAAAPGTCVGGYCFEEGNRVVDVDPDPAVTNNVTPIIRRGAVPFRILGLTEDQALDGYGARLQYAITENLAVTETYLAESGGISIVNGNGDSMVSPLHSAHFVIFSTGPDKQGAYSREGVPVNACAAGAGIDTENCNTSAANDDATYALADYSLELGANGYDDFLKYYSSVEQPLWRVADANGFHIRDLIDAEAGGRVGIGTGSPVVELDIGGHDFLADGNLMTTQICDPAGNNCFLVDRFAGDHTDYECPVGEFATGISAGKIQCSPTANVRCPSGSIMEGVNADGSLDCRAINGCPSTTVTLCENPVGSGTFDTFSLPAALQDTYIWTTVSGLTYQERWRCRYWGAWQRWQTTGTCSCTPQDTVISEDCDDAWAGNWTGTIDTRYQLTCPDETETYTSLGNNCACVNDTESRQVNCPSGFTGDIFEERDWVCSSGTSGSYTGWVEVSNTCTCVPDSDTRTIGCPTGYSGDIDQQNDFQCPAGTWTGWYDVVDNCSCTGASQTQVIGCPAPQVGNITQQRDYNCTTDSWDAWYEISNTCGSVTYTYRNKSTQNGPFGGPLSVSVGDSCSTPGNTVSCSTPASGGQYWHYDVCECE